MCLQLLKHLLQVFLVAGTAIAYPGPSTFNNVTIFQPPSTWSDQSTSYGRTVLLSDNNNDVNTLLATWSFFPPGRPYSPIFRSLDSGRTWKNFSQVFWEAAPTGGIILQPFLFELPEKVGKYPAGTVLIAPNAIPEGFSSTNIQLYASFNKGYAPLFDSNVS